jgi:regulator of sirC expression with transglutaminase-like and TPR domain
MASFRRHRSERPDVEAVQKVELVKNLCSTSSPVVFYGKMQELLDLLVHQKEEVPLDVAALQLSQIEYPHLTVEPFLQLLDSHANELSERLDEDTEGEEFITLLNDYLFEELGFRGNEEDYYHPANSCLSEVLMQRVGIPISLGVVYMEIGRRLDRPLHGIGLPGHFLVQYDDGDFTAFIDPFHGGRVLAPAECFELSREVTNLDVSLDDAVLQPVSRRHILIRMLNNLRSVYFRRQDPKKAVAVLDLLIGADPFSPEEYKQRGVCQAQINAFKEAQFDLETYLKLSPAAKDRKDVEHQIELMKRWLAATS